MPTHTYESGTRHVFPEAHSGTQHVFPEAHPWRWLGAFLCAMLIYFIVLSAAGSFFNG